MCIGQALFENLFLNGIQLVTKVKNNMRNSLMSIADKILLRKRALIEMVNDELKNIAQIEHSRHRSFSNFIANSLSVIAAYCFFEKKPAIDVNLVNDGQLSIFDLYRTHINIEILFIRNYYSIFMVLLRTLRSIFCISYTTLGCCNMILARSFMSFLIS